MTETWPLQSVEVQPLQTMVEAVLPSGGLEREGKGDKEAHTALTQGGQSRKEVVALGEVSMGREDYCVMMGFRPVGLLKRMSQERAQHWGHPSAEARQQM